jgi:HEAT repeat protein
MRKKTNRGVESSRAESVSAHAGSHVEELIQKLSSHHVVERERAREELVALGEPVLPELLDAFGTADERGRLEVCKTFTELADPSAIPTLIQCLEDDHQDVRWVAAEGLLNIGGPAIEPLLLALIDRAWAHTILDSAVHVLHGLARRVSKPIFEPLISSLRGPEPAVSVPTAAQTALSTWRELVRTSADTRGSAGAPTLEPRSDKAWYDRRR